MVFQVETIPSNAAANCFSNCLEYFILTTGIVRSFLLNEAKTNAQFSVLYFAI